MTILKLKLSENSNCKCDNSNCDQTKIVRKPTILKSDTIQKLEL